MTFRTAILAAAAVASLGAVPAFADDIEGTAHRQQERIQQGRRDGSLTRHEVFELEREQAQIRGLIQRARADGRIDPYERREIERAQDAANRHIFVERHDAQSRPYAEYRPWYRRWY